MNSFWRFSSRRWLVLRRLSILPPESPAASVAVSCSRPTIQTNQSRFESNHTQVHTWTGLLTLGLLSGLILSEDDPDKPVKTNRFPLTAQCAQRVPSKDRQSAIKALDVVADVAEEAQPAVVSVTSMDSGFLSRHTQSTGSGFIIDSAGHVVTNAHVVGYRNNVSIHLSDGRSFSARVLAIDVSSDLALVKVDLSTSSAKTLPHLPLAADLKSVRPGHFVLALGSPLMLANSVTVGVVSALERDLGHSEGLKYIQTDAIITFGNSGGPLVNLAGEVIGVNSMVAGTGVGFAIPVDQVRKFVSLAMETSAKTPTRTKVQPVTPKGEDKADVNAAGSPQRRYLGLVMRTLTPELAFELASRSGMQFAEVTEGVLIHAVMRDSPAQRAGLKAGDVIVSIDGLPITNAQQVYTATENREQLSITVIRRGKKIQFTGIRTEKV